MGLGQNGETGQRAQLPVEVEIAQERAHAQIHHLATAEHTASKVQTKQHRAIAKPVRVSKTDMYMLLNYSIFYMYNLLKYNIFIMFLY